MELMGPQGFFHAIGISFALISILAFVRSTQREATAIDGQGDFMPLTPTPTSVSFNPNLELKEIEAAAGVSKVEIQTSFEELVGELNSESESEKN
jgi:hypothetical protein